MRNILLLGTALSLAACGESTAPQTVGSVAPPAGSTTTATTTTTASFVNPVEAKTYSGLGAVQHYEYTTRSDRAVQSAQLYAGDANTVRDSGISVTYDPRDAIFDVTINRAKGDVSTSSMRFQDPVHRTAFGGTAYPQAGVPNLNLIDPKKQIQYLEAGGSTGNVLSPQPTTPSKTDYIAGANGYSSTIQTFFYQKPGTTTKYVTYAGFVRNTLTATLTTDPGATQSYLLNSYSLDRAAFAYGELTNNSAVPKSGSGTYSGDMLATVVYNPNLDKDAAAPSYLQWIDGSHVTTVDFASLKVATTLTGTVLAPALDAYSNGQIALPGGSAFKAAGTATIDLAGKGGFTGTFASASVNGTPITIAGSSIDGAFYGPAAEEIGAGFRIVGGNPDERIDILGTFTGKK